MRTAYVNIVAFNDEWSIVRHADTDDTIPAVDFLILGTHSFSEL